MACNMIFFSELSYGHYYAIPSTDTPRITKRQGGRSLPPKTWQDRWTLVMAFYGYLTGMMIYHWMLNIKCYGIWGCKEDMVVRSWEYHGIRLLDIVGIIFDWLVARNLLENNGEARYLDILFLPCSHYK